MSKSDKIEIIKLTIWFVEGRYIIIPLSTGTTHAYLSEIQTLSQVGKNHNILTEHEELSRKPESTGRLGHLADSVAK